LIGVREAAAAAAGREIRNAALARIGHSKQQYHIMHASFIESFFSTSISRNPVLSHAWVLAKTRSGLSSFVSQADWVAVYPPEAQKISILVTHFLKYRSRENRRYFDNDHF